MEMILLRITNYGWGMIAVLVLSVLVALKVLKRNDRSLRPGCLGIGYVSLIAFCLFSLSIMLAGMLGSFVLHAFSLPRYEARVVDYSSYEDKDSHNRRVTMFRSVVAFTACGKPVTLKTDISSSAKRAIGEAVTVGYKPGMEIAEELSGNKYMLIGGAAVLLFIMGYFALGGIAYALGWRMKPFYNFGMSLLLYFIFPLAMLFLLGGMGYAVVLYFMGQKPDMPLWAVVVCSFFCLVLFSAFLGYIRMLTERARRIS